MKMHDTFFTEKNVKFLRATLQSLNKTYEG